MKFDPEIQHRQSIRLKNYDYTSRGAYFVTICSYQKENIGKDLTQYDMLKKLELSISDFKKLKEYCNEKNIIFLTTLHTNSKLLDLMNDILPAFKIGSGDLTNHVFLAEIAKKKWK